MLSCEKCLSPAAIETNKDEHEAVGVERRTAEVEGYHNNYCNKNLGICRVYDDSYQAFASRSF